MENEPKKENATKQKNIPITLLALVCFNRVANPRSPILTSPR